MQSNTSQIDSYNYEIALGTVATLCKPSIYLPNVNLREKMIFTVIEGKYIHASNVFQRTKTICRLHSVFKSY